MALGGTDLELAKTSINDVAATLKPSNSTTGFSIIMDEAKSSILVAGEDG